MGSLIVLFLNTRQDKRAAISGGSKLVKISPKTSSVIISS